MYDVAIVGAGPAGATLARLIGRRYRVLLVDKRRWEGDARTFASDKCCGGLLAPDAQRMLSSLGLGLPRDVLEDPQQLRDRALIYLGEYLGQLVDQVPVLLFLEDIHWADDSSLDTVNQLAAALASRDRDTPFLVICLARRCPA